MSYGFPKPEPRRSVKRRQDAEEAAHIKAVREELFARESRCFFCGETQFQTALRFFRKGYGSPSAHEMHETVYRSKTRGLPLAERFNQTICVRACPTCHRKHGHRERIIKETT